MKVRGEEIWRKTGQNVHIIRSFLASTSKAHEMFTQASVGGSLNNLQGQLLHNNEERKSAAKKERDRLYYQKNKEKKITQVKERRKQMRSKKSTQPLTQHVAKKSERRDKETERREASRTAAQERKEKIRQQTRERVRKYHEKKQTAAQEDNRVDSPGFANRTSKKRATDKVKKSLPSTPRIKGGSCANHC